MPEWLWALLVGAAGVAGYWLRDEVDVYFSQRKEARQFKQGDIRALRDELLIFLGEPRAHFTWLQDVLNVRTAGGIPSPDQKAHLIADWVYRNAPLPFTSALPELASIH